MKTYIIKPIFLIAIISTIFTVGKVNADEITFFVVQPERPIIWTNPSIFASSVLYANKSKATSPIGHVNVELKCDATDKAEAINIFDGMTTDADAQILQKAKDGYGLGTLFFDYPGKLHGVKTINNLKKLICAKPDLWPVEKSRTAVLKLKISSSVCHRMNEFYEEFKERGLDKFYGGFRTFPLHGGKGANCATFATSFLEAGGILTEEMQQNWYRRYIAPNYLIGTPENPKSIAMLLLAGIAWAQDPEDGVSFETPDPQLIYDWIHSKEAESTLLNNPEIITEEFCHYTTGISMDFSKIEAPQGPIFQ